MSQILKTSFILFVLFLFQKVNAQPTDSTTKNPRIEYPSSISWYIAGPTGVSSITYERFLGPTLNIEAGYALVSFHIGLKAHLWGASNREWTPYLGASIAYGLLPVPTVEYVPYIPIGIQYVGDNNLNFSFELAPFQPIFSAWNLAGIKLGYRW